MKKKNPYGPFSELTFRLYVVNIGKYVIRKLLAGHHDNGRTIFCMFPFIVIIFRSARIIATLLALIY